MCDASFFVLNSRLRESTCFSFLINLWYQQLFHFSMGCSFDHYEAERCNESLPIWDTISTYDFLARLQSVTRKGYTYLPFVMIDFTDDTRRPTERNALDRISLRLATARTHRGRLLDYLFVNFDLALHDVASFEDGALEVVADVVELDAAQADSVVVFEPESDRLQFRHFLYVKSLKVSLGWPLKVYLFIWHIWYAPQRQLSQLSSRPSDNRCQFILFEEFQQVFLLLLEEILDSSLRQFCSLLSFSQVQSPNILIFLQQLIECLSVKIDTFLVLREVAHKEAALESLLVQLILKLCFDCVGFSL